MSRNFVADAYVSVAWVHPAQATQQTEDLLEAVYAGAELHVPALWPLEVANALVVLVRRRKLTEVERTQIGVSIVVQMLFQPWFSDVVSGLLRVSAENRQTLVLISAMPAAILGPVFAARYECAAKTATLLTFTHIVVRPVMVPAGFAFLA